MREFGKQVNASIVDLAFISRVRRKLRLDQREASAIFGGGINAFSRYESGKTKPLLALVKLLKVLDRHPDLLEKIRAVCVRAIQQTSVAGNPYSARRSSQKHLETRVNAGVFFSARLNIANMRTRL